MLAIVLQLRPQSNSLKLAVVSIGETRIRPAATAPQSLTRGQPLVSSKTAHPAGYSNWVTVALNESDRRRWLCWKKRQQRVAFRYPPEILDSLEDMLHDIKKRQQVKLSKNAVAVAAIVFFLSDYETFGEERVLFQMLIEQHT